MYNRSKNRYLSRQSFKPLTTFRTDASGSLPLSIARCAQRKSETIPRCINKTNRTCLTTTNKTNRLL